MGGYYNVYTATGQRTFHYRFTCGKCHKTTPWNSCSIEVKHTIQTKSSLSQVQQQLDEGLSEKLNDRIDAVRREVEKCNGRASLIEELIELLKNDEFAAKGFWESLRRENELSNHYHVPGNCEGGKDDWYFSDYNLERFPHYPFK